MSRDNIAPYKSLIDGDMSGTLTTVSTSMLVKKLAAVQCVYTGSPVGSLALQVSVDGISFVDALTQAVTGADTTIFNLPLLGSCYIRVKYTFTSGTGSLNVTVTIKE